MGRIMKARKKNAGEIKKEGGNTNEIRRKKGHPAVLRIRSVLNRILLGTDRIHNQTLVQLKTCT
jgi:hypothetical protein